MCRDKADDAWTPIDRDSGLAGPKNRIPCLPYTVSGYSQKLQSQKQSWYQTLLSSPVWTAVNALPGPDWSHSRIAYSDQTRKIPVARSSYKVAWPAAGLIQDATDVQSSRPFPALSNNIAFNASYSFNAISLRVWITPVTLWKRRVAKPTSPSSGHTRPYSRTRVLRPPQQHKSMLVKICCFLRLPKP